MLAVAKSVETPNLCTQRNGGHEPHSLQGQEFFDHRIVGRRFAQPFLDSLDSRREIRQLSQVFIENPTCLLTYLLGRLKPFHPGNRPCLHSWRWNSTVSQEGSNPEFAVAPLGGQLLPKSNQPPQLANHLGRQPHARQITYSFQVCQHSGVGKIRFVGALLHPGHVAGMSQIDRPAGLADQFFGQFGRSATSFNRRPYLAAVSSYHGLDRVRGIRTASICQHRARTIHDTHLYRILVVVQTHKNCYLIHVCCSFWKTKMVYQSGLGYTRLEQQAFIPI